MIAQQHVYELGILRFQRGDPREGAIGVIDTVEQVRRVDDLVQRQVCGVVASEPRDLDELLEVDRMVVQITGRDEPPRRTDHVDRAAPALGVPAGRGARAKERAHLRRVLKPEMSDRGWLQLLSSLHLSTIRRTPMLVLCV